MVISMLLALTGCGTTSGRLGELPSVPVASKAGKVVAVRISSIVGSANGYAVALDGKDLFGIGSGEHTELLVPEGEHSISVKCFGGMTPTLKEHTLRFVAKANEVAYFKIGPSINCGEISVTTEAEALKLIERSKFISLEKTVSK
ncbi:MAG: hypothetical protein HYU74_03985 [Dechloromonas sp.]|nr:hypothetical protein [Dechloromonas sp.]